MNWGDFKKAVEEMGMKDEDEIWYIDCDGAPNEVREYPVSGERGKTMKSVG